MAILAITSTAFEKRFRMLSFSTPCRRRKSRHIHAPDKRE